jgi:hypothetical protein
VVVANAEESNPQIKTSLRETIAVYMERAEKIKEFLLKSPDYQDPSPIPPPSSSTSSSSSSSSVTSSSFAPVSGGMPPYSQPQFAPAPGGMPPYGGGGGGYPQQQQPAGSPWDMYGMQGMQGMPAQHQQVQQLQQQQQQYRPPGSPTSFEDDRFRQQQQPIVTLTDSFDDEFAFVDPFNPKTSTPAFPMTRVCSDAYLVSRHTHTPHTRHDTHTHTHAHTHARPLGTG